MGEFSDDSFEAEALTEKLESEYHEQRREAKQLVEAGRYESAAKRLDRAAEIADDLAECDPRLNKTDNWIEKREENESLVEKFTYLGNQTDGDAATDPAGERDDSAGDDSEDSSTPFDPAQFDVSSSPSVDFSDVGGMTDVKQKLLDEVADPIRRREIYREFGVEMTHGVLLQGPPGTGKTHLSRALAGELDWNFAEIQASGVASSLVGQAAQNITELFELARENQPCILFFDEIDAIAMDRAGDTQRTQSEEMMTSTLLTEMSDMTDEEVVVLGATNQPEKLDDALLRPGRFTEVIEVGLPDAEARKSILRVHLRDPPVVNDDINYESFVEATEGLSAAEIGEIADTAARLAIKESEEESLQAITQRHITDAISEIKETKSTKEEGGEYL